MIGGGQQDIGTGTFMNPVVPTKKVTIMEEKEENEKYNEEEAKKSIMELARKRKKMM